MGLSESLHEPMAEQVSETMVLKLIFIKIVHTYTYNTAWIGYSSYDTIIHQESSDTLPTLGKKI